MTPFRTVLIFFAAMATAQAATADPVIVLGTIRQQSCAAAVAPGSPLKRNTALDSAAERIARGETLRKAIEDAGYRAVRSALIQISGAASDTDLKRIIDENHCAQISDKGLRDAGAYRRDKDVWIVLAEPFTLPALDPTAVKRRALALVNEARAQPRRCGNREFASAKPVKWSAALERAAVAHARDMAGRSFISHTGTDGGGPGERVSRTGYAWIGVAENIAGGQRDADAVIKGWLTSPGHCANLMDGGFTETGFAFAADARSELGIYWAQVFAAPDIGKRRNRNAQ